jgi:hypothetical protein
VKYKTIATVTIIIRSSAFRHITAFELYQYMNKMIYRKTYAR